MKEVKGTILVIITAIISGFSIVANRFFVIKVDPLVLTSIKGLFIGIVFLGLSFYISKKHQQKFNKVSWKYLILIGVIGGGIAFWLFFTGLKLTTAGRAAFLHKTLPIYATIFAFIFLKERITKKQFTALSIMLIGLFIFEISSISYGFATGDLLVIGATILWAIENTISKKVMINKESNWVVTFSRMFFGSIVLFFILIILGKTELLLSLNLEQILYIFISTILLFLYVLTWYLGLKYINLSKASTILLIAPVISLIGGILFLNEEVLLTQIIGSALILGGVYIITKTKSEKRQI